MKREESTLVAQRVDTMASRQPGRYKDPAFRGYVVSTLKELGNSSPHYWVAGGEVNKALLANGEFVDAFNILPSTRSISPEKFLAFMADEREIGRIRAKMGFESIRKIYRHEQPGDVFTASRPDMDRIAENPFLKALYEIDVYEDGFFYNPKLIREFLKNGFTKATVMIELEACAEEGTVEHVEIINDQKLFRLPREAVPQRMRPVNTRYSVSSVWNRPRH
jgi:hypothetical protein